jgi:HEAT repeat protein
MSAIDRMIAYHLERVKDKNPDVRIKSIEELAELEAEQALGTLEEIFRTDPDEAVRRAAQQAGRTIYTRIRDRKKDDGA